MVHEGREKKGRAVVSRTKQDETTPAEGQEPSLASRQDQWRARQQAYQQNNSDHPVAASPAIGPALVDERFIRSHDFEPAPLNGQHLLQAVHTIASAWRGESLSAAVMEDEIVDDILPTPEELTACADDADVHISYHEMPLKQLEAHQCPCVILLNNGNGLIISQLISEGHFEIEVNGRGRAVTLDELQSHFAGIIFLIKPKPLSDREDFGEETEDDVHGVNKANPKEGGLRYRFTAMIDLFKMMIGQSLQKQKTALVQLLLASGMSNILMLALPLFTMSVYDRVIPHLAMETLWALGLGVFIALAADLALRSVKTKFLDAVGLNAALALQGRLYRKLVEIRMAYAPRTSGGLVRIVRDIDILGQTVPALFVSAVIDFPFFVILLVLLASIGGWVVLAPLIGVMVLTGVHLTSYILARRANLDVAQLIQKQSNQIHETIESLETVKATTAERLFLRKWELLGDETSYASHLSRHWSMVTVQTSMVMTQLIIACVLIIGVYQISNNAMTVGALAASTLLVGRSITPINQLLNLTFRAMHLTDTAYGLLNLLSAPTEPRGNHTIKRAEDVKGAIALRNVTFQYQGSSTPSLYEISLDIRPGEKVGLIGRVGSGKSTLLRLMLRLHEPQTGSVMLDGADIRQYSPKILRRAFSFMQQDSVLFEGTLRDNIFDGP
jgi:ATP-binding cassette subfamily C protein LapB